VTGVQTCALPISHAKPLPAPVVSAWNADKTVVLLFVHDGGIELGTGFVGIHLEPVDPLDRCLLGINESTCMRSEKAAVGTYVEYQPVERVVTFQITEFVLYVLLAAGLFAVTFRLLRNGGKWKPSRSHRRIGTAAPVPAPVLVPAAVGAAVPVGVAAGATTALLVADEPEVEIEASPEAEVLPEPEVLSEPEVLPEPEAEPETGPDPETAPADQSAPDTSATQADG